ncbi:major facilitator superfamily protein [Hirsutella rhossiliensis]|uniref:Major facilitator superfamily domain-containing protein n=1 Tax=Hirsutella rhossiliensis TaxID=111463 RepID=A0A9P8SG58_9HYPO|nr:major facilitator superfamily domain-containing protein [Hirsutella rhossiliensis]KAH0959691.1 major facilitator superfamily domain-containing protein [Hirsutella rhossiliensis]
MGGVVQILRRMAAYPDRTEEQRRPYLILLIVCSAMFLDLSNLSAVTIALPTMGEQLGVDQSQLQWVIAAYALTFGSFLLLGGRGGDIFGHRRVLLFGSYFFALFTLVCALAPTFVGLVIGRAFQGIGAGFTIPSAQAHVAIHFPSPSERAKALGFWAAAGSVGFIAGLILGGVLTALLSWRWIFWISLILSALVIPAAHLVLPRPDASKACSSHPPSASDQDDAAPVVLPQREEKKLFRSLKARLIRFDVVGICLGVPGLLLLTYALTSGNISGWGSASIVSTLVLAAVLLALFALQESRASQALVNPRFFDNLSFTMTLMLAVATYAVRQACSYFLTLQLQSYGNSPLRTALLFLPVGVSALLANSVAGRLVPILGARAMFVLGWALCIPGVVLFSLITPESSYWRFTFPGMILYISGLSAVYITANFVVVSSAAKSDQGAVAGVFNVALQVGGSVLGLAVLTAVAEGINSRFGTTGAELSEVGYQSVYYSCIILCAIALALSLLAVKVPDAMRGTIWKKKEEAVGMKEMGAPAQSSPRPEDNQPRHENPFQSSSSSAVNGPDELVKEPRHIEQNDDKA